MNTENFDTKMEPALRFRIYVTVYKLASMLRTCTVRFLAILLLTRWNAKNFYVKIYQ